MSLRPFKRGDENVFADLFANAGFVRFSGHGPYSRTGAARVLDRFLRWSEEGLPSPFALVERITARLFGFCGFLQQEVDGQPEIEIGYRLHPEFWGRGMATEAARAVRDHGFRDLNLERVISLVAQDNRPSRRVAEKIGMNVERETLFKGFPVLVFVVTRPEWQRLTSAAE